MCNICHLSLFTIGYEVCAYMYVILSDCFVCILKAPENFTPPVPSALPFMYGGIRWNSPGYRACATAGKGPGGSLYFRDMCWNL